MAGGCITGPWYCGGGWRWIGWYWLWNIVYSGRIAGCKFALSFFCHEAWAGVPEGGISIPVPDADDGVEEVMFGVDDDDEAAAVAEIAVCEGGADVPIVFCGPG
jgi:hypothetical protein